MTSANVLPHAVAASPSAHRADSASRALRTLNLSASLWLGLTLIGQVLLAAYVLAFYGRAALQGHPEAWNQVLAQGYVPGQPLLNAVLAAHLTFTVVIVAGGVMQLLPALRQRAPALHRWTGRLYLLAAAILSVGGLILIWIGGETTGDGTQKLAISLNAALILFFAQAAWRDARTHRYARHRRQALRLFLVVSGVWFFRVGLMLWIALNRGPVGFDPETFTGPVLTLLAYGQFLVPLAILELYFLAIDRGGAALRWSVGAGLALCSLATIGGVAAASLMLWLPHLG